MNEGKKGKKKDRDGYDAETSTSNKNE